MGFVYAIAAALTWGLVYTIDQRILSGLSPLTLLFVDSVVGVIVLLPVLFLDSSMTKGLMTTGKTVLFLIVLSVALATLANFFIFSSIKLLGASSASIIEISYPFFVVGLTFLFFGSVPNIAFYIGGLLIFAGSAVIIYFH